MNVQNVLEKDADIVDCIAWFLVLNQLHVPVMNSPCWCCSVTQSCQTPCDPMDCSIPGLHDLLYLPEFAQTHVHWVDDAIQAYRPCHPLLLLPSIFPSIRVFSNESAIHIRWPKYWNFSFRVNTSHEYSELISFKIDWFDLCPQETEDSQESSPTPQFKSIISLALSLLYCPTLTTAYDY